MPSAQGWTVSRPSTACVDIHVDMERKDSWEFWTLLTSDRHWDNPDSDHRLQKKHLEEAKERNAPVICNGDFFCAMQGKWDKRQSKSHLRPEHQKDNYLDALVETAAEWFAPYAHQFAVIGEGNHETAIRKHHETDLVQRLVALLNANTKSTIQACGYGSWVRFCFKHGNSKHSVKLKRFHGSGGGGPVTKGTIQTNRRAAFLGNADIIFSGHIHEEWVLTTVQEYLNNSGRVMLRKQIHVSAPTYKEEYRSGEHGWHVERGAPPKPVGAMWLKFKWKPESGNSSTGQVGYVAFPAD